MAHGLNAGMDQELEEDEDFESGEQSMEELLQHQYALLQQEFNNLRESAICNNNATNTTGMPRKKWQEFVTCRLTMLYVTAGFVVVFVSTRVLPDIHYDCVQRFVSRNLWQYPVATKILATLRVLCTA